MSSTIITKYFYGEGNVLIDPASVKLSDFGGTFGVKRTDTDAVVVVDGTSMTRTSTGIYTYTFTDPAPNLVYEVWVEFVVGGDTFYSGTTVNGYTTLPGYTIPEMMDELGVLLNELNQAGDEPFEFTHLMKINSLNKGQRWALQNIDYRNFEGMFELETNFLATGDGEVSLSSLTYDIYNDVAGLIGVRLSNGKWCKRMTPHEFIQLQTDEKTWTTAKPMYQIRGGSIWVEPHGGTNVASGALVVGTEYYVDGYTTVVYNSVTYNNGDAFTCVTGVLTYTTTGTGTVYAATRIDVYYMREPVDMYYDPDGDEANHVGCELSIETQDIILEYAAYLLFRTGNDSYLARAKMCFESAAMAVDAINRRIDPEYTAISLATREANLQLREVVQREARR